MQTDPSRSGPLPSCDHRWETDARIRLVRVISMFEPSPIDTGIEEAAAYRAKQSKTATPAADGFPNPGEVEQQSSLGSDQSGSSTPALDFLDDFFKADKRHLVARGEASLKSEPNILTPPTARGSKPSSPKTATPALIFISAQTRSREHFTRRLARTTLQKRSTFG